MDIRSSAPNQCLINAPYKRCAATYLYCVFAADFVPCMEVRIFYGCTCRRDSRDFFCQEQVGTSSYGAAFATRIVCVNLRGFFVIQRNFNFLCSYSLTNRNLFLCFSALFRRFHLTTNRLHPRFCTCTFFLLLCLFNLFINSLIY